MASAAGYRRRDCLYHGVVLVGLLSSLVCHSYGDRIVLIRYPRFGWTGFTSDIHWMAPTASGVLTGFGIYVIFLQCFNYLIDSYLQL